MHTNDDPVATLELTLLNGEGHSSLAPRVKESPLNRYDDNPKWNDFAHLTWEEFAHLKWSELPLVSRYSPLLDRYNEILVEAAISTDGSEPTDFVPVFHGLLGDGIRSEHTADAGVVINISARDMAKRLQDDVILEPIKFENMYASQMIQALLDQRFGPGVITLHVPDGDDFFVTKYEDEYVDTWQAIQKFCEQSDKDVRFMLDEGTGQIRLTYWTPSTAMVPAWSIEAKDIWHEALDTSDASLRHRVVVRYVDTDGMRQEVVLQDLSRKKPKEPIRALLIEESDTESIRDEAAATRLASSVLSALKTEPATDSLTLPFTPYMRIYDVIQVTNSDIRSEPEVYAIEELRLNFSLDEWSTEVVASDSVKVRHEIWLEKEAKRGVKSPFKPGDLTTKRSVLTPEEDQWECVRIPGGIEVRWDKPPTPYWDYTEVHLSRTSDFDPSGWDGSAWTEPPNSPALFDGEDNTLIGTSRGQSLAITAGIVYRDTWYVKIVHVDTSGNRSAGNVTEKSISVGSPKGSVVVAASDANVFWKSTADYVCDGSGDQVEINQALAAGDRVELSDGTFVISGAIEVRSEGSLVGQGSSTVIKLDDGVNSNLAMVDFSFGIDQYISSLVIDGNKTNQSSGTQKGIQILNGCAIDHVVIRNLSGAGIDMVFADNVVVSGTSVSGCRYGISISGGGNNRMVGNICENNDSHGIRILSAAVANVITGNICRSNGDSGVSAIGGQNIITTNICKGNGENGIYIISSTTTSIVGNTCAENGEHGIDLINSHENTISGNDVSQNGRNGISIINSSRNTITSNNCVANSQSGNEFYNNIDLSGTSSENNIQSNTCRKGSLSNVPRYGIEIGNTNCVDNFVTNNDLKDSGASGGLGNFGTGTITSAGNRN